MTSHPGPAAIVHDTAERVRKAASRIDDPIMRAEAIGDAAFNIPALQQDLRRQRADAIREALAGGASAASVAEQLGISRQMISKVLRD